MANSLIGKLNKEIEKKHSWSTNESVNLRLQILTEAFGTIVKSIESNYNSRETSNLLLEIVEFVGRMRANNSIFIDDEYTILVCTLAIRNSISRYEKEANLYSALKEPKYKRSFEIYNKSFYVLSTYIGAAFHDCDYEFLLNKVLRGDTKWQKNR